MLGKRRHRLSPRQCRRSNRLTTLLSQKLAAIHHWSRWAGHFDDIVPELAAAYELTLGDLREGIPSILRDPLVNAARELCQPNPALRGPLSVGQPEVYATGRVVGSVFRTHT